MKKSDLIDLVYEGKLDTVLEDLYEACRVRQKTLRDAQARRNKRVMRPGRRVQVTERISPKYLSGYEGTVVPAGTKPNMARGIPIVYVDFGMRIRRYGPVVGMPANCLTLVDSSNDR